MLLALWTLCGAAMASSAMATPAGSLCPAPGRGHAACASAAPILRGSDSEAEEGEEEARGDEEEAAASTEARAEEAGSSPSDSPSSRSAGPSSNPGAAPTAANLAIVSQLKLTTRATASLRQHAPQASSIGFSFTLSASTLVKVTLLKQTSGTGGKRWTTLPDSLTVSAGKGRVSRSLSGHNRLSPGRYRLTVKPAGGDPRSIYLSARR
ncbi:MAG: hypothetical protein WA484_12650 [Solirubrobacteraceae bacterium]